MLCCSVANYPTRQTIKSFVELIASILHLISENRQRHADLTTKLYPWKTPFSKVIALISRLNQRELRLNER